MASIVVNTCVKVPLSELKSKQTGHTLGIVEAIDRSNGSRKGGSIVIVCPGERWRGSYPLANSSKIQKWVVPAKTAPKRLKADFAAFLASEKDLSDVDDSGSEISDNERDPLGKQSADDAGTSSSEEEAKPPPAKKRKQAVMKPQAGSIASGVASLAAPCKADVMTSFLTRGSDTGHALGIPVAQYPILQHARGTMALS
jgi:hypothetical protein